MLMLKRSQHGFGVVELLCFIVMFSMVGLIGWYVINENMRSQETLDNIGGAEVQTSSAKPAAKAGDKFTFKELGLEIVLPKELAGLTYSKGQYSDGELYKLVTPEFKKVVKGCEEDVAFAQIFKQSGTFDTSLPREGSSGLLRQFDGYYLAYGDPMFGAPCDDYESVINQQDALVAALKQAFETAELVD